MVKVTKLLVGILCLGMLTSLNGMSNGDLINAAGSAGLSGTPEYTTFCDLVAKRIDGNIEEARQNLQAVLDEHAPDQAVHVHADGAVAGNTRSLRQLIASVMPSRQAVNFGLRVGTLGSIALLACSNPEFVNDRMNAVQESFVGAYTALTGLFQDAAANSTALPAGVCPVQGLIAPTVAPAQPICGLGQTPTPAVKGIAGLTPLPVAPVPTVAAGNGTVADTPVQPICGLVEPAAVCVANATAPTVVDAPAVDPDQAPQAAGKVGCQTLPGFAFAFGCDTWNPLG